MSEAKYDALADGFSEREYADPVAYSAGRARVIVEIGPHLERGATVVDLGCGDAIMAGPLLDRGLVYTGVDSSTQMIEAARRRHPDLPFVTGRFEEYRPPDPVDATICLRCFYQPEDRVAFFRGVAEYTKKKFVFDFRRAAYSEASIKRDLRAAGFDEIKMRPYFIPQRHALPGLASGLLEAAERAGPLGLQLTRFTGIVFVSASVTSRA
jgi:predicted TPR repeat methyltransferase